MVTALLLAVGIAAPPSERLVSVSLWVSANVPASAGPRLGVQIGPFEVYGGFDPIALNVILDDQVTGYTFPWVAGARAHLPLPIGGERGDVFAGVEFSRWRATIHHDFDEVYRRASGLVGVRWQWGVGMFELAAGMTHWEETRQFSNYEFRALLPAVEVGTGLTF